MAKAAKKPSKTGGKIGAPSKKTPELMAALCDGIASGRSARAMCVHCGISQPTLWRWLEEDENFRKQYTRAKERCADVLAAEIIEIADDGRNDTYMTEDGPQVNHDAIARSRLRVDARKWYASKLVPKKYGDRIDTTVSGPDGGPIRSESTVTLAPDEAYKRMLRG